MLELCYSRRTDEDVRRRRGGGPPRTMEAGEMTQRNGLNARGSRSEASRLEQEHLPLSVSLGKILTWSRTTSVTMSTDRRRRSDSRRGQLQRQLAEESASRLRSWVESNQNSSPGKIFVAIAHSPRADVRQ